MPGYLVVRLSCSSVRETERFRAVSLSARSGIETTVFLPATSSEWVPNVNPEGR